MEDQAPHDLGNIRFRPRSRYAESSPEDIASTRFAIGVAVFLVVALAYPWYSYWVQSHLLARDIEVATESLGAQVNAGVEEVARQSAEAAARQSAARDQRRRASARVVGATMTRGKPVVIVDLGQTTIGESRAVICRSAAGWLGQSVSGKAVHVQRYRGRLPAISSGDIRC